MRILTITRRKSFVGCAGRAKVYIDDPAGELDINGVRCRKLGELKNGQQQSFPIGFGPCRVYVIADKISRSYCNEYFSLPEGQEPVFLSGKFSFDPGRGNAFRFDGNDNPEIAALRKKGRWKGWTILIAAMIVGAILGYLAVSALMGAPAKAKVFRDEGFSITLTEDFKTSNQDKFDICYLSQRVAVMVLSEDFANLPDRQNTSVEEYAQLVIASNNLNSAVRKQDGAVYFEYDRTVSGKDYSYVAFVFRGEDEFWMVQFSTESKDAAQYREDIFRWASSVEVNR